MNWKIILAIIEILVGILLVGMGFMLLLTVIAGSWLAGIGPFLAVGGYLLAKDGQRTYDKLRKK